MSHTPASLKELLTVLREHGVTKYATPELTVEILPQPHAPVVMQHQNSPAVDPDEELYWSVG